MSYDDLIDTKKLNVIKQLEDNYKKPKPASIFDDKYKFKDNPYLKKMELNKLESKRRSLTKKLNKYIIDDIGIDKLKKPDYDSKYKIKKDEWCQRVAVQRQFKVGDLVRGNNNHPAWPKDQLELFGGIIISTDGPTSDGGDWSVPFYQVLWPNGVLETVGQDWIEQYV
jgi:hypothetical protein